MPKKVDINDFAMRVERLCDFLLIQLSEEQARDGSSDVRVIEILKEDAADIQTIGKLVASETLEGLSAYMNGV